MQTRWLPVGAFQPPHHGHEALDRGSLPEVGRPKKLGPGLYGALAREVGEWLVHQADGGHPPSL